MIHSLFKSKAFLTSYIHLPPILHVPPPTKQRKTAFLTGATGFIGGYLLIELLQQNAFEKYYCLVRGEDERQRLRKLKKSLYRKGKSFEELADRIVVLKGDIGQPRLGLSLRKFQQVSQEVDHIYHFAGTMNWVSGFGRETEMNIAALREVIAFAAARKTKYVHYASSMGAWSILQHDSAVIMENKLHDRPELLAGGYCQLKWINEKICEKANERGIPVSVYRIGDVKGHSKTGHSDLNNFGNLLLLHMLTTGTAPDCTTRFNFLPVDYLAKAIAAISLQTSPTSSQSYQFSNPERLSIADIAEAMAPFRARLRLLPPKKWYKSLDVQNPISRGLRPVFKPFTPVTGAFSISFFDIGSELYQRAHDTSHTEQALAGREIHCPAMLEDGVLRRYMKELMGMVVF